jgi:hypothetical protein
MTPICNLQEINVHAKGEDSTRRTSNQILSLAIRLETLPWAVQSFGEKVSSTSQKVKARDRRPESEGSE